MLTLNRTNLRDTIVYYTDENKNLNSDDIIFKPLTFNDKDIFNRYIADYKFKTSEYTFTNLLIWRKGCNIQYAIYKDILIIKKKDFKGRYHFMQPIGYNRETLKDLIEKLKKYKEETRMEYLFKDVEKSFLNDIKELYGDRATIEEDRNNFDYIYDREKLANLSGKKLHSKKNHFNYFVKTYNYTVKDLSEPSVKEDCIAAAENWHKEKYSGDEYLTYELEGIKELIAHMDELNQKGIAVYVDGIISAFTIGECVNKDMAIIYIEKGKTDIRGLYTFINKVFAQEYLGTVKYVNREQDLGIEGLRKAKKSYNPLKLEEKYSINL